MTLEEKLVRLRGYSNNIRRYRRLLETRLSDIEREYVEGRILAERAALEALAPDMSWPREMADSAGRAPHPETATCELRRDPESVQPRMGELPGRDTVARQVVGTLGTVASRPAMDVRDRQLG